MTAPTTKLTVTDRCRLKELSWEAAQTVIPGKVMWCRGRKIIGYGNVASLDQVSRIPPTADTACLSAADFADVIRWLQ